MTTHKHVLRQKGIFNSSELTCECGLRFIWDITRQEYAEVSPQLKTNKKRKK